MYIVTKKLPNVQFWVKYGATIGSRTRDLILTMDALYQLSYRGAKYELTLTILTGMNAAVESHSMQ